MYRSPTLLTAQLMVITTLACSSAEVYRMGPSSHTNGESSSSTDSSDEDSPYPTWGDAIDFRVHFETLTLVPHDLRDQMERQYLNSRKVLSLKDHSFDATFAHLCWRDDGTSRLGIGIEPYDDWVDDQGGHEIATDIEDLLVIAWDGLPGRFRTRQSYECHTYRFVGYTRYNSRLRDLDRQQWIDPEDDRVLGEAEYVTRDDRYIYMNSLDGGHPFAIDRQTLEVIEGHEPPPEDSDPLPELEAMTCMESTRPVGERYINVTCWPVRDGNELVASKESYLWDRARDRIHPIVSTTPPLGPEHVETWDSMAIQDLSSYSTLWHLPSARFYELEGEPIRVLPHELDDPKDFRDGLTETDDGVEFRRYHLDANDPTYDILRRYDDDSCPYHISRNTSVNMIPDLRHLVVIHCVEPVYTPLHEIYSHITEYHYAEVHWTELIDPTKHRYWRFDDRMIADILPNGQILLTDLDMVTYEPEFHRVWIGEIPLDD